MLSKIPVQKQSERNPAQVRERGTVCMLPGLARAADSKPGSQRRSHRSPASGSQAPLPSSQQGPGFRHRAGAEPAPSPHPKGQQGRARAQPTPPPSAAFLPGVTFYFYLGLVLFFFFF